MAGPTGPQPSSSSRDHSTRTGRPGSSRASSTASAAASSEALCPYTPAPSTWCTVSWPGSRPSPAASARRSGNSPWLWVHTVIRGVPSGPLSQRAIAQLGAIEAWAMNGRVNSACQERRTRAAASGSRRPATAWSSVGWLSRKPFRSRSSGSDSRTVHRAARASRAAAATAIRSWRASTPRNEPSRSTASTPSGRSAGAEPVQRGGRAGRPDDPAEHHARQHQVVQEPGAAGRPCPAGRSRGALRPATDHRLGRLGRHGVAGRPGPAGPARSASSSSAQCG